MTVTDQLKIIDTKIKANQTQYDLDRLAAKTSAYTSGDLTDEDLGYKPSIIEQAKFDYSPLGISLSKAFKKDEVKSVARSESDFNNDSWLGARVILIMIAIMLFSNFTKGMMFLTRCH